MPRPTELSGTWATQLLITIRLDAAPVVRLSQMFHGRVSIGQWAYYKFYTTPPDAPASVAPRSLVVRVWQEPPAFVGVRVALKVCGEKGGERGGLVA